MFSESIVLVVGAEPQLRADILRGLGDHFHVIAADSIEEALARSTDSVDIVVCELESRRANGLDVVRDWRANDHATPIIALSNGRDVGAVVEAMKQGASDCVLTPLNNDDLRNAVERAAENRRGAGRSSWHSDSNASGPKSQIDIPPGTSLEDLERAAVEQALVQHQGNRTHAAKTLGISVRTLQRKLKAWGLPDLTFHNAGVETSNSFSSFMLHTDAPSHHVYGAHAH